MQKYTIKDLKKALKIRKYLNKMDHKEFFKLYESETGEKLKTLEKESIINGILNNTDVFIFSNKEGEKNKLKKEKKMNKRIINNIMLLMPTKLTGMGIKTNFIKPKNDRIIFVISKGISSFDFIDLKIIKIDFSKSNEPDYTKREIIFVTKIMPSDETTTIHIPTKNKLCAYYLELSYEKAKNPDAIIAINCFLNEDATESNAIEVFREYPHFINEDTLNNLLIDNIIKD